MKQPRKKDEKLLKAQQIAKDMKYETCLAGEARTGDLKYLVFWKDNKRAYLMDRFKENLRCYCFSSRRCTPREDETWIAGLVADRMIYLPKRIEGAGVLSYLMIRLLNGGCDFVSEYEQLPDLILSFRWNNDLI